MLSLKSQIFKPYNRVPLLRFIKETDSDGFIASPGVANMIV